MLIALAYTDYRMLQHTVPPAVQRGGSWLANPGLWATMAALIAQRLLHIVFLEAPFAPYQAEGRGLESLVRSSIHPLVGPGLVPGLCRRQQLDHLL